MLLRYPGGKSRLVRAIAPQLLHLIEGAESYGEPFVGGGSVALWIAEQNRELRLALNDADPELMAFWAVVCGQEPGLDFLLSEVERVEPLLRDPEQRMDCFNEVRARKPSDAAGVAFRYFFLNKTCWGGKTFSTPIGGWNQDKWKGRKHQSIEKQGVACQYNAANFMTRLKKANELLKGRTTTSNIDGLDFIKNVPAKWPLYVDPPYFILNRNGHYRFKMTAEQHGDLAQRLVTRRRWLLSYDNSDAVKQLYSWADVQIVEHFYASAKDRSEPKVELIITQKTMQQHIAQSISDLEAHSKLVSDQIENLKKHQADIAIAISVLRNMNTLAPVMAPVSAPAVAASPVRQKPRAATPAAESVA